MKQERVSMPMSSAGIIGFSPDLKISGVELDPKFIIAAVAALVLIVNAAAFVLGK
jgi:preprotein translocase subunit Sec61beta